MASVVLHAEPKVHDGVPDPRDRAAGVCQVAVVAEVEVRDRRQRHLAAHTDVVPQARDEAEAVGGGARASLAELEAPPTHAALHEESAARGRVEVHGRGDVPHRLGHAAVVLGPEAHLATQAHAGAGRAAQLDRDGEAAPLRIGIEAAAAAAGQAVGAVPEPEDAPEAVARRRGLCRGEVRDAERERTDERPEWPWSHVPSSLSVTPERSLRAGWATLGARVTWESSRGGGVRAERLRGRP